MSETYWPLVICGATGAGLGIAAAAGEKALLVERSALIGHEFIASYNPGDGWASPPESAFAQKLQSELLERNLLSAEGLVHLPAMPPVLFRFVRERQQRVMLMTEIIEVSRRGKQWVVTMHNASGLQRIVTDRLIDTTPTAVSLPGWQAPFLSRSINALMAADTDVLANTLLPASTDAASWFQGLMPGEAIVKMSLEGADDWQTARFGLHSWWQREHASFRPWTLAAVADVFEVRTDVEEYRLDERWDWFPSSSYANLLQAFDAGYRKGCHWHETVLSA